MKLANLQNIFQDYLIKGTDEPFLPQIAKDGGISAQRRIKIYYDAYRIRLLEILRLDFPKTHTLMGDEHFDSAFYEYLDKHPSHHFSVRYFGQHFPTFLKNTAPFQDFPVISEMAAFEWLVSSTIDAKDAPIASVADFTSIPPENWPELQFTFHPSMSSCYFEYDTPQIWQIIEAEGEMRAPVKQPAPVRWLFWRKGIKSYFRSCNAAQDNLYQGLLNEQCFADLCENLLPLLPENEIPSFVAQTLYQWVSDDLISEIK